jgi:hypothetical protein
VKHFFTPFEDKAADTALAVFLLLNSLNALYLSWHLSITPAPLSIASKILVHLMEVDPTACKGQNTQQNRAHKHEKINTIDGNPIINSSNTTS